MYEQDGVMIDLNRLAYRDYRAFIAGEGIDDIEVLCRVVVAWDFAGDPSQRNTYDDLGMLDLLRVQAALRGAITAATGATPTGN